MNFTFILHLHTNDNVLYVPKLRLLSLLIVINSQEPQGTNFDYLYY